MAKAAAKFKVGDNVEFEADPAGTFPAGSGVIEKVMATDGQPTTYKVKAEDGSLFAADFKDSELTTA